MACEDGTSLLLEGEGGVAEEGDGVAKTARGNGEDGRVGEGWAVDGGLAWREDKARQAKAGNRKGTGWQCGA